MMEAKKQMYTLEPYKPGKPIEEVKRELGLSKVTKLASNENPFGYSEKVGEAIIEELSELPIYPDGYAAMIREAVSQHLGVEPEMLIFGNGSDEIIQIICRTYLTTESNTVMADLTFPQYRHNAVIEGTEIREVPLHNGKHDLPAMLNAIDELTKIVWVCSPNNPTGTYTTKNELLEFIKLVPKTTLIVMDEAYYEYVVASDYPETVPLLKEHTNLLILRTFSKAYGLAALRVGYGIANKELIKTLDPAREPFNVNRLAQAAGAAALNDQAFIDSCRIKNRDGLKQYEDFCEEHQLSYYPSQANFILINFRRDSDEVFQYLLTKGFIVRSGNALGSPGYVRITIGSQEQNADIINVLSEWLVTEKAKS
jgi:histidinol-phosphate aminotransferase